MAVLSPLSRCFFLMEKKQQSKLPALTQSNQYTMILSLKFITATSLHFLFVEGVFQEVCLLWYVICYHYINTKPANNFFSKQVICQSRDNIDLTRSQSSWTILSYLVNIY